HSKRRKCTDNGSLFSYAVHQAGIPLRYKFYCYRWDAGYADQMHDKFFVFDGEVVASGSYNLSDNAKQETMENMLVWRDPDLAGVFERQFEGLWVTGESEGRHQALLDQIAATEGDIPVLFPPTALERD